MKRPDACKCFISKLSSCIYFSYLLLSLMILQILCIDHMTFILMLSSLIVTSAGCWTSPSADRSGWHFKPHYVLSAGITLSAASLWSTPSKWPTWEWLWWSAAVGSFPLSSPSCLSCRAGTASASTTWWGSSFCLCSDKRRTHLDSGVSLFPQVRHIWGVSRRCRFTAAEMEIRTEKERKHIQG